MHKLIVSPNLYRMMLDAGMDVTCVAVNVPLHEHQWSLVVLERKETADGISLKLGEECLVCLERRGE